MQTDIDIVKIYFKGEDIPFILDYEDLEKFLGYNPCLGNKSDKHIYLLVRIFGRCLDFTRILLNYYSRKMVIDHLNRNTRDYRKFNLEIKTRLENDVNRGKSKGIHTSKFKGVRLDKRSNKWQARMFKYGIEISLGYFEIELEAALAYDKAFIKFYGNIHGTNKSLGLL